MSSIGQSTSRPLRDYDTGQIIANFPDQLARAFDLEAGTELSFAAVDDGITIYLDPSNAPCYAPRRRLRRQNSEFVVNIPADVVDAHGLDATHDVDYGKPHDRRIPLTFQEATDD